MVKIILILLIPVLSLGQANRFAGFGAQPAAAGDADSTAFVNKVVSNGGSLTATEKTAIGTLIKQLKDSSLWTKFAAIWPMVGGTSTSCNVNLIAPATFSLTFVASPTISSNGVAWNGTTQYANTGLTPSTAGTLTLNSTHLSYYSRQNTATNRFEMGCQDGGGNRLTFATTSSYAINQTVGSDAFTNTDKSGFFTLTRTASNLITEYRNGASVATTTSASVAIPTTVLYIGCNDANGTASTFTDRQCAFASIGSGMTAAQALTFYRIVQAFQTTLSRQV